MLIVQNLKYQKEKVSLFPSYRFLFKEATTVTSLPVSMYSFRICFNKNKLSQVIFMIIRHNEIREALLYEGKKIMFCYIKDCLNHIDFSLTF